MVDQQPDMRMMRMLFHVHTAASYDSIMRPATIVNYCVRHKIDILAVTDHDRNASIDELRRLCGERGVVYIPAIEFASEGGDIVGLFVDQEIDSKKIDDVVRHIRNCNGLVALPHPYKHHDLKLFNLDDIDLIEVHNSRTEKTLNEKAKQLAVSHSKPELVGADAHLPWELGVAVNEFVVPAGFDGSCEKSLRQMLLKMDRHFQTKFTTRRSIRISQVIKGIKHRRPRLILRNIAAMLLTSRDKPLATD